MFLLGLHRVKSLPPKQEMRIQFLGGEDSLEKEMQPTPVFLPGKFHGQRNLYIPWGHKELDMTEQLNTKVLAHVCFPTLQ